MKKTIEDINVNNKRVIVRVDFNVPLRKGEITDDFRIRASLPTLRYLLENNASVIIITHLGRPKGKINDDLRLVPVFYRLKELLPEYNVKYLDDCLGTQVKTAVKELKPKEVLLLENLRFYPEEEKNDMKFAQSLASLGDYYVNDAFGVSHRKHASVEGITHFLPSVAGYLLKKEIDFLQNAVENPKRPFVVILGGKKVSDKIQVLTRLVTKCDTLLIGGAMSFTFLKAIGNDIGDSILDVEGIKIANQILTMAKELNKNIILPKDIVIADTFANNANTKVVASNSIPNGWQGLDIGPDTIEEFSRVIRSSKTVLWNGPVGVFELPKFMHGTKRIAETISETKCLSIIGGGDTAAAIKSLGLFDKMTHVSTGGGASLKLLEGKSLPGLEALDDK